MSDVKPSDTKPSATELRANTSIITIGDPSSPTPCSCSAADQFKLAAEIFLAVRSAPPEQRPALLSERCAGNAEVKQKVERLLAGSNSADKQPPTYVQLGEQLRQAATDAAGLGPQHSVTTEAMASPRTPPEPGTTPSSGGDGPGVEPPLAEPLRVGKYVLLQKIGEGGFGVVYAAEQREPIRRRVAMKIVKAGMGSKEVIARFEAERQALALLDHPNIAKVFEAGSLDDGRPYFVMEHVPGVPITDYCDLARLTTRQRLDLFIQVCHAVQHAHQKGIIHRDIKPSNVLVTMFDAKPVPKVIDFGIAKAIHQPLTSSTLFTEIGRLMGTPEYMSPEQAASGGVDVDTRTDVYSLGVLLFQLLTGTLPFEPKALRKAGYDGIVKMISELDPPRPSVRFGTIWSKDRTPPNGADAAGHRHPFGQSTIPTSGKQAGKAQAFKADSNTGRAAKIAASHGTDPSSLLRQLRGDLDWIVLRAMEKNRLKRYESIRELISDIERSLRHEPITARPPSAADRLGRFARRHRIGLVASLAVATGIALGMAGIAVALVSATRQNAQLESSVREAQAQRQRAVEAEQAMRGALSKLAEASDDLRKSRDTAIAKGTEAERLLYITQLARSKEAIDQGNSVLAARILAEAPASMRGWEWAWLVQRTESGQTVFHHPTDSHVTNASWSPDGRRIVTTHEDSSVIIWDAITGSILLTFRGHGHQVQRAVFSPDGRSVASAGYSGEVKLWDSQTGNELRSFAGHEGDVWWIDFSPDAKTIVTGDESGKVRLFDAASGRALRTISAHSKRVWSASFSPNGSQIATSSLDGSVAVFDAAGDTPFVRRSFGDAWPWTARFSPDGRELVIGQFDGSVGLFDARTLQLTRSLSAHNGEVFRAEFNPSGNEIVSGADDGRIQLHNARTGALLTTVTVHQAKVRSVAFSPDGACVLSASADGTAMIWRNTAVRGITLINDAPDNHNASVMTPDGKYLLVGSMTGGLQIYESASARLLRTINTGFNIAAVGITADGSTTALGWNGRLCLADLATGDVIRELRCPAAWPLSLAFSPDGSMLAATYDHPAENGSPQRSPTLLVFSTRTGEILFQDTPASGGAASAQFSPDGRILAALDNGAGLWLYAVPSGKPGDPAKSAEPWEHSTRILTTKSDGRRAVLVRFFGNTQVRTVDSEGTTELWALGRAVEMPTRAEFATIQPAIKAAAAELSPDGTRLAAIRGTQLLLYDVASGNQLLAIALPFSDGFGLSYTPSGRAINVISARGTIALLELDARTQSVDREARRAALDWISAAQAAHPGEPVAPLIERDTTLAADIRSHAMAYAPYRDNPWWLWMQIERQIGWSREAWLLSAKTGLPLARRALALAPNNPRMSCRLAVLLSFAGEASEAATLAGASIAVAASGGVPAFPTDSAVLAASAQSRGEDQLAAAHAARAADQLKKWPWPDEQHDIAERFSSGAKTERPPGLR